VHFYLFVQQQALVGGRLQYRHHGERNYVEPQTTYSEYRLAAEPCALPQFFIGAGSGWASPEATYGIICWALKKHVIKKNMS
jgi:hypothetical protein